MPEIDLYQCHCFDEWHEDIGDVLWWRLPVQEPPYVGSPNDLGIPVKYGLTVQDACGAYAACERTMNVGGWPWDQPDYPDLVWTFLPNPTELKEPA